MPPIPRGDRIHDTRPGGITCQALYDLNANTRQVKKDLITIQGLVRHFTLAKTVYSGSSLRVRYAYATLILLGLLRADVILDKLPLALSPGDGSSSCSSGEALVGWPGEILNGRPRQDSQLRSLGPPIGDILKVQMEISKKSSRSGLARNTNLSHQSRRPFLDHDL